MYTHSLFVKTRRKHSCRSTDDRILGRSKSAKKMFMDAIEIIHYVHANRAKNGRQRGLLITPPGGEEAYN
jgi:hypothetical protein